jgi:hypothetical protein
MIFDSHDVRQLIASARVAPAEEAQESAIAARISEIAIGYLLNRRWQQASPSSKVANRLQEIRQRASLLLGSLPNVVTDQLSAEVRLRILARATEAEQRERCPRSLQQWLDDFTGGVTDLGAGAERFERAIHAIKDLQRWSAKAERLEMQRGNLRRKGRKVYAVAREIAGVPTLGWFSVGSRAGRFLSRTGQRTGRKSDDATQALIDELRAVWLEFWKRKPGASGDSAAHESGGPFVRFVRTFMRCLESKLHDRDLAADPGLGNVLRSSTQSIRKRIRAGAKTPRAARR